MSDNFPFVISCPACGNYINKSYKGTRSHVTCDKCKAGFYFEITENGPLFKITKEPKSQTQVPDIPA